MAAPSSTLPEVPVKHADFISHVASHPDKPLHELLEPFKQYDAKLREVFAQEPDHAVLADPHVNIVPVFAGHEKELKIRARNLDSESDEEKERYVMPLAEADRRPNGTPAVVQDMEEFKQNFSLFSESSLVDMDWSNVVAAGSAVVTCLMPVPEKYKASKKALRKYYHEMIAPASDVDLFIYGLSEEEAVKKIIEIEQRIKDSILTEITTIRTKNAITIASQYPTRHVQIVLRVYKSVAEILTGFDVDCSCAAYDGQQVWAAPRALTAYMTQTNTIDLTRRSPSYENRLSKYSHRGFEVYWPLLDRGRIDPTIYERNFGRTVGLARLLVLERLPSKSAREEYMDERRRERGRPAINRYTDFSHYGNIKNRYEDEVAEWVDQEDVSDYHTFTIPYGPKYHAKKIEKLLYTKDLLLNSEWNKPEDREVNLHRHPAFFGYASDVIHDCCGFCPKPVTPEEHDVAEEEAKIYVSGEISFIRDNPGRQAIGSFNPITDDDWTEMAYVGNTARLCQAIVDGDLEHVEDWLAQEGSDPNCRDYTGRTPLHLAVMSSTPEIVNALIAHGARLVARLADGRTALHLAAARGNVEMVKSILQKSEENEEEEAKKEEARKQARIAAREAKNVPATGQQSGAENQSEDSDLEVVDGEDSDEDMQSTTTGSYIKVKETEKKDDDVIPEEDDDEPDVYDVNVLSWDTQCSPLHYAILNGHTDVVKELVQTFGADVLLPIKLIDKYSKTPRGAILTLVLALKLPLEKAKVMAQTLLELGASSAQADMNQTTALHYVAPEQPELLDILFQHDEPAAKRALNHLAVGSSYWSPDAKSPLMTAIYEGNALAALKLLGAGADATIQFKDWLKSVVTKNESVANRDSARNHADYAKTVEQPVVLAVQSELPEIVLALLERGAAVNTLTTATQQSLQDDYYSRYNKKESLLDLVQSKIRALKAYKDSTPPSEPEYTLQEGVDYLKDITPGSYKEFIAKIRLEAVRESDEQSKKAYEERLKKYNERKGVAEKKEAIMELLTKFKDVKKVLLAKGAKSFRELHPDKVRETTREQANPKEQQKQTPYSIQFGFSVYDLTDESREAYLRMFQAAWDGDLETIKSLTLANWGATNENTPLKIAVEDKNDQSPFSLAVLRGHKDVARGILEIAFAQYQPEGEEKKAKYRLAEAYDDDSDCGSNDSSEIPIYKQIVDDKFTIDNIGEVATQVKSNISPSLFMAWSCSAWDYKRICKPETKLTFGIDNREVTGKAALSLFRWAISANDKDLFTFMVNLDLEWEARLAEVYDKFSGLPTFSLEDFRLTIACGRLDMLAEEIKHYGAGMEVESLVKKSGVKFYEKPKYYQGLSVHGKKRSDWLRAAQGTHGSYVNDLSPPLLHAARKGSLASVEWFLSDAPVRHYMEFAEKYKDNKFIKHLNTAGGGFEKVLRKWLSTRREQALHCAVLAKPSKETTKLIEYLIKGMPESLETKSDTGGHTPLALAFSLHRLNAAKTLIAAGADQTVRDSQGRNILHLLLCSAYTSNSTDEKGLKDFLDLIDKRLISSLLVERCSDQPGSLTPLARWMRHAGWDTSALRILLDFAAPTSNEHLEMLDGSGETPVHHAVKSDKQLWLKVMLEYRPDLLHRENSVGRTPYELAEDAYIANCVTDVPSLTSHIRTTAVLNRDAHLFAPKDDTPKSESADSVWEVCQQHLKKYPGKRRLVSLMDANEVANRLANRTRENPGYGNHEEDEDSEDGSEEGGEESCEDEVMAWYANAERGMD